ncbi:MAG: HlyD family type I secretion periplasmic adaptor subunit [Acidiferrobacteraceae bacterium]
MEEKDGRAHRRLRLIPPWPPQSATQPNRLHQEFAPATLRIQERSAGPFLRIFLWSLFVLVAGLIAWSYFGRIAITATARAKFVPSARTQVVQTMEAGTITGITVHPGDRVRRGQILVTLDPKVDRATLTDHEHALTLDRLEAGRIASELAGGAALPHLVGATPGMIILERRLAQSDLALYRAEIRNANAKLNEAQTALAASAVRLREYRSRAALARDEARDAYPLVAEGALSGMRYDQLRDRALKEAGAMATQEKEIVKRRLGIESARSELVQTETQFANRLYKAWENERRDAYRQHQKWIAARHRFRLDWLRAPVAGTIQSVTVASLGTVVEQGQTLVTLVPTHATLVVEGDLPARDLAFVKIGQPAAVKVDAYPFSQYGTIPGTLVSISPTTEANTVLTEPPAGEDRGPTPPASTANHSGSAISSPALFYQIKVRLERDYLVAGGRRRRMRTGMTATVDIQTGHRRVIDFLLDPIISAIRNGTTVR